MAEEPACYPTWFLLLKAVCRVSKGSLAMRIRLLLGFFK